MKQRVNMEAKIFFITGFLPEGLLTHPEPSN